MASVPPTRMNSPSCSTRSSFTWTSGEMSPISSRNSVPPSASSNSPFFRRSAPVNAPFSYPNRVEPIRFCSMALQLATRNFFVRRLLSSNTSRAKSSLPVPDSPYTITGTSLFAAREASAMAFFSAALRPTSPVVSRGGGTHFSVSAYVTPLAASAASPSITTLNE